MALERLGASVPSISETIEAVLVVSRPELSNIQVIKLIQDALEQREKSMISSWPIVFIEEELNKSSICTVQLNGRTIFIGYSGVGA